MKQPDEHQVQMIAIDKIRVINSRERDRAKHDQVRIKGTRQHSVLSCFCPAFPRSVTELMRPRFSS